MPLAAKPESIRFAEAAAARDAGLTFNVLLIGTNDVLRHIAPAILCAGFVWMVRILEFTRNVHRLATQVNTSAATDWTLFVVILFKRHNRRPYSKRSEPRTETNWVC